MRTLIASVSLGAAGVLAAVQLSTSTPLAATDPAESGRFVWNDLMATDVNAARDFYGSLLGWRFEETQRNGRRYLLARLSNEPVAGIVDVSALRDAAPQWLSFMTVSDVDQSVAMVQMSGGQVLLEPREVPSIARAAVVMDPQGAPLGLAQLRRVIPQSLEPGDVPAGRFFWQEYLATNAQEALGFYTRLIPYQSSVSDARLGVEYHTLRFGATRARAGLFQLPPGSSVLPNWLPYVRVDDPVALAARVVSLGGRVLLPAAPERRNGSLVVAADPGGAPFALQRYPFQ